LRESFIGSSEIHFPGNQLNRNLSGCENCYRIDEVKRDGLPSEGQNGRPLIEIEKASDPEIVASQNLIRADSLEVSIARR
jgi:hypothetical protein